MSPASTSVHPPRHVATEALLFAAFLVPTFAFQFWRNSFESTVWMDEVYTLMLAHRPLGELVDLTAVDAHPPLYYIIARGWLLLGNALGIEPGVVWMRGLNLVGWLAMASTLWFAGRRLFGAWPGAAGALAGVAMGGLTEVFRNLRNYTFVCPAMLGCATILAFEARNAFDADGRRPVVQRVTLWVLYAVLGSLALWMHLLSALALAALGLTWIAACVLVLKVRGWSAARGMVIGGGIAQLAIIAGFSPWLAHVSRQLGYIASVELLWMTPATPFNFLRVFAVWYPMGNVAVVAPGGGWGTPPLALALGLIAVFVPLAMGLLAAMRRSEGRPLASGGFEAALGVVVAVALLNVGLQWAIHALGLSKTFHGLRYPVITAPVLALALAGVAGLVAERLRWPAWRAALLVAPWLLACAYGNHWTMSREVSRGIEGLRPFLLERTANASRPLYVMPARLVPVYRHSLRGFDVRPLADAFDEGTSATLHVLNLNRIFYETDDIAEKRLRALLTAPDVSAKATEWVIPPGPRDYSYLEVKGPNVAMLRERRARLDAPTVPAAVLRAGAANQRRADGWSSPDASPWGRLSRWGQRPDPVVRFDDALPAGRWRLTIRGARPSQVSRDLPLVVRIDGVDEEFRFGAGPGPFEVVAEFDAPGDRFPLRVRLDHPLVDAGAAAVDAERGLTRQSVRFDEAWIEPVAPAPPPPSGS